MKNLGRGKPWKVRLSPKTYWLQRCREILPTLARLERLKAEAEEQMEETTPYLSDARTSEEMYKAMISKGRLDNRPEIKWNPIQDRL